MAGASEHVLRSPPDSVRALRDEWATLVDRIDGLTWELEQEFRFGQRITRTDQGFVMGGTLKGGSSSMWYPASREQYDAYKRWCDAEAVPEARDDEAFFALEELCQRHGVALRTRRQGGPMRRDKHDPQPFAGYGPLYRVMLGILEILPAEHLSRPELSCLQLGGWGPDAAKASAYHEGTVMMYDFACRGALRTFLGLFVHELGHAHEVALSEDVKNELHTAYQAIAEADALIGIEFLVDAETRKLYQKFVFTEFLAEMYMIYVACGGRLREEIEAQPVPAVRQAWERVYGLFRDSFFGHEYA